MTNAIPTIQSVEDRVAVLEEIAALLTPAHNPEPAARLALMSMKLKLFKAKAYGWLRENLSDIFCWLHLPHPDWQGGFHVKASPGPDPRHLAHLKVWEQERDEVRPAIWLTSRGLWLLWGTIQTGQSPPGLGGSCGRGRWPECQPTGALRDWQGSRQQLLRRHEPDAGSVADTLAP